MLDQIRIVLNFSFALRRPNGTIFCTVLFMCAFIHFINRLMIRKRDSKFHYFKKTKPKIFAILSRLAIPSEKFSLSEF